LAVALFAVPIMAQQDTLTSNNEQQYQSSDAYGGTNGVDILGQGIFETAGNAFHFPIKDSANIDGVTVGNDKAMAFGPAWTFKPSLANAQNNLEIKKNQQDSKWGSLINAEQITIGNREALAFGAASATNNMKIVTNQMGAP
jgi:hypothetical protein